MDSSLFVCLFIYLLVPRSEGRTDTDKTALSRFRISLDLQHILGSLGRIMRTNKQIAQ